MPLLAGTFPAVRQAMLHVVQAVCKAPMRQTERTDLQLTLLKHAASTLEAAVKANGDGDEQLMLAVQLLHIIVSDSGLHVESMTGEVEATLQVSSPLAPAPSVNLAAESEIVAVPWLRLTSFTDTCTFTWSTQSLQSCFTALP